MKALNVLKSPIVEIGSDSDLNLHSNAVVLFATREQIQEAISELEALQQPKSCECFEDVIFVWNETSNFIESIVINTEDLALDMNKNYKVCIVELRGQ